MKKYGIENVRGGSFCQVSLDRETTKCVERMIGSTDDKCHFCGKQGHFIRNCPKNKYKKRNRQLLALSKEYESADEVEFEDSDNDESNEELTIEQLEEAFDEADKDDGVYEWDGTSWQPRGFNIVGENTGDNCGSSISLNDDGNIIAVGATLSDGGNGSVRIFEWDGIRWQIRDKLTGTSGDAHGYSVAINSDGTVVVFGGYGANGGAGEVRIHAWNNSTYEKRGNYIPGESTLNIADNFGTSVAINGDGTIIAGGAMYADPNNNTAAGNVRVFSYNDTSDSWDIRGTFNGVNAHDYTTVSYTHLTLPTILLV